MRRTRLARYSLHVEPKPDRQIEAIRTMQQY